MSSILRLLTAALAIMPLCAAAPSLAEPAKKSPAKPVAEAVRAPDPDVPVHLIATPEDGLHVHQRIDGNLAGRISHYDDTGTAHPSRARVAMVQRGQLIASVRTDEWGRFQVVGLRPGVYSVLVASADGVAAASIHVKPFEANVPSNRGASVVNDRAGIRTVSYEVNVANNPSVLNISLTPASDLNLLNNMMRPGEVPPQAGEPQAAAAGGGGGGGGGLGGLLGAAGMGLGLGGLSGGGGGGGGGGGAAASRFLPNTPARTGVGSPNP